MCTELPVNLDIQKGGKPNLSHRGSKEERKEGSGGVRGGSEGQREASDWVAERMSRSVAGYITAPKTLSNPLLETVDGAHQDTFFCLLLSLPQTLLLSPHRP